MKPYGKEDDLDYVPQVKKHHPHRWEREEKRLERRRERKRARRLAKESYKEFLLIDIKN